MDKAQLIASTEKVRLVRVPNDEATEKFTYVVERLAGYDALGGKRWELRSNVAEYDLDPLFKAIFDYPSVDGVSL